MAWEEEVDEGVDGGAGEGGLVFAEGGDFFGFFLGEDAEEVGAVFFHEERDAFGAAEAVADGVEDLDGFKLGAVTEMNGEAVGDGAFCRIEVGGGVGGVFLNGHEFAKLVDAWIGGGFVFVVLGSELSFEEADGDHVLQAMVAVGGIVEGSGFVDDADRAFVGVNLDLSDFRKAILDLRVELDGSFHGGLGMELGREGNLKKDVFHDVAVERLGEGEGLFLEEDILKSPEGGREGRGVAGFSGLSHEGVPDASARGISSGPRFPRPGVGRVSIGAESATVEPGIREGLDDGGFIQVEHATGDGSGGNADEDDVVEADAVEAVFEGEDALDFVSLDAPVEDVADGEGLFGATMKVVGEADDAPEVVGGVPPFGREPGVVEV